MYKINQEVIKALKSCIKEGGTWFKGKTQITAFDNKIEVSYFGEKSMNKIFTYWPQTDTFWFSDCGWPSRTAVMRINACLQAIDSKYSVLRKKGQFAVMNTETKKIWVCGDRKVEKADLIGNH